MAGRSVIGLAFAGFVMLGMPEGAVGVAWPSIRADLGRPLSQLGLLLVLYTGGYLVASAAAGAVNSRLGTGRMLAAASAVATGALVTYAAAPVFAVLGAAAIAAGTAGALVDAGTNSWAALTHGTRVMNLLHASFGLGATLGPLLMTALITLAGSWRAGYGVLAAAQAVLTAAYWRSRRRWSPDSDAGATGASKPALAHPLVLAVSLATFFVYTGLEVTAGQWSFSLFTEERGMAAGAAGVWVAAYWAALTLGRVTAGVIGDRIGPETLISAGSGAAVAGAAVLWWDPAGLGPAGLVLIGFSLAPVFPELVVLTPRRLGSGYAPWAIGYQLAAASLGAGALPGAMGLVVAGFGVAALGPYLVATAALLVALTIWLRTVSDRSRARLDEG